MALLAQLYGSRREAERHVIETDATLRSHDQVPVDILVADLSTTGCLFICTEPLPLGSDVTIGLTGLGRRSAKIVRSLDQRYGCEFLERLSEADLLTASTTPGGTIIHFPAWPLHPASDQDAPPATNKLPGPVRLVILVGATLAGWSAVIGLLLRLR